MRPPLPKPPDPDPGGTGNAHRDGTAAAAPAAADGTAAAAAAGGTDSGAPQPIGRPDLDYMVSIENARKLKIHGTNTPVANVNPFLMKKYVDDVIGEAKEVRKLRSGDLFIETITSKQTADLLKLKTFCELPVEVTKPFNWNTSQGIVSFDGLRFLTDVEIMVGMAENPRNPRVLKVWHFPRKNNLTGNMEKGNTAVFTFDSIKRPHEVFVGYYHCNVRPHYPKPMRCYKCQEFNHHKGKCEKQEKCGKCSKTSHITDECPTPTEYCCANCQGDHPVWSRDCPIFQYEHSIVVHKVDNDVSYPEARKVMQKEKAKSYAAAAAATATAAATAAPTPTPVDNEILEMTMYKKALKDIYDLLDNHIAKTVLPPVSDTITSSTLRTPRTDSAAYRLSLANVYKMLDGRITKDIASRTVTPSDLSDEATDAVDPSAMDTTNSDPVVTSGASGSAAPKPAVPPSNDGEANKPLDSRTRIPKRGSIFDTDSSDHDAEPRQGASSSLKGSTPKASDFLKDNDDDKTATTNKNKKKKHKNGRK